MKSRLCGLFAGWLGIHYWPSRIDGSFGGTDFFGSQRWLYTGVFALFRFLTLRYISAKPCPVKQSHVSVGRVGRDYRRLSGGPLCQCVRNCLWAGSSRVFCSGPEFWISGYGPIFLECRVQRKWFRQRCSWGWTDKRQVLDRREASLLRMAPCNDRSHEGEHGSHGNEPSITFPPVNFGELRVRSSAPVPWAHRCEEFRGRFLLGPTLSSAAEDLPVGSELLPVEEVRTKPRIIKQGLEICGNRHFRMRGRWSVRIFVISATCSSGQFPGLRGRGGVARAPWDISKICMVS